MNPLLRALLFTLPLTLSTLAVASPSAEPDTIMTPEELAAFDAQMQEILVQLAPIVEAAEGPAAVAELELQKESIVAAVGEGN